MANGDGNSPLRSKYKYEIIDLELEHEDPTTLDIAATTLQYIEDDGWEMFAVDNGFAFLRKKTDE